MAQAVSRNSGGAHSPENSWRGSQLWLEMGRLGGNTAHTPSMSSCSMLAMDVWPGA
jgi:hypothetical protein